MAKLRTRNNSFDIIDNLEGSSGSRKDSYWMNRWINNDVLRLHHKFRNKIRSLPKSWHNKLANHEAIVRAYRLRGFQFGNWVSVEDRYNYIVAAHMCLYDLNHVLRFGGNLGLGGELGVAFGARGNSPALAHFEPHTFIINLKRYPKKVINPLTGREIKVSKEAKFLQMGGVGSFAHEYGHFLDYFFGLHYDQSRKHASLSGGRSIAKNRINNNLKHRMRMYMDNVLETCLWKNFTKGVPTEYQKRLDKLVKLNDSDYLLRRTEIFARTFEQYIGYKLHKTGIVNKFLHKPIYRKEFYLQPSELKRVIPHMDKLISEMRKYV